MLTIQGEQILLQRCSIKDKDGTPVETAGEIFKRVAEAVGKDEREINIFFHMMRNLEFLPNSPTLVNAGRELPNLSACYVVPIEDSMEGIFNSIKASAIIHKSGGGTGFDFSNIRSKDSIVNSTGGKASGPISFMKVFNEATETIKQGGVRRGANMGVLRVDHPDIMEFISCKQDTTKLTNFNISVAITDEFIEAYNDNFDDRYKLSNGNYLHAKEVMNAIVHQAHKTGEPGIIFIDEINRHNPYDEPITAVNPCGEQPLRNWLACNLGSINMTKMLDHHNDSYEIDWNHLETTVRNAIHFLDNIVDLGKYPLPQIKEQVDKYRPIGLGLMGFADMLYMLELPYNSQEARDLAVNLMGFINDIAYDESKGENATLTSLAPTGTLSMIAECSAGIEPNFALAYEKHVMDKDFTYVNPVFAKAIEDRSDTDMLLKTITDTGSIKNIDSIPSEFKSIFVTAQDISPTDHVLMQAAFQKYCDTGISKTINLPQEATEDDILRAILLAYKTKCKGLTVYRDGSRGNVLTTGVKTGELSKDKYNDNHCNTDIESIQFDYDKSVGFDSINLPLIERVQYGYAKAIAILEMVWDKYYSDDTIAELLDIQKSFDDAIDSIRTNNTQQTKLSKPFKKEVEQYMGQKNITRPDKLSGTTYRVPTNESTMFITVNYKNGSPIELFTTIGKAGGNAGAWTEAISRLISLALQSNVDAHDIANQLVGINSGTPFYYDSVPYLSIPDAIGKTIIKSYNDKEIDEYDHFEASKEIPIDMINKKVSNKGHLCPVCNNELVMQEGCMTCPSCNYSKCN